MASKGAAPKTLNFSATYNSPANEPFTISEIFTAPPLDSVEDKTKYLNSLRKTASKVQEQVNKELTARMEEDKAPEATGNGKSQATIDEAKEEENYGEEVQEEED